MTIRIAAQEVKDMQISVICPFVDLLRYLLKLNCSGAHVLPPSMKQKMSSRCITYPELLPKKLAYTYIYLLSMNRN
jgi:hypothetical protein